MKQYIRNIQSIMCPFKKVNSCKTVTPWLTPDIYKLIRQKKLLIKKYKTTKNPTSLTEMRLTRNELNSRTDRAKAIYIENTLLEDDCIDITAYILSSI